MTSNYCVQQYSNTHISVTLYVEAQLLHNHTGGPVRGDASPHQPAATLADNVIVWSEAVWVWCEKNEYQWWIAITAAGRKRETLAAAMFERFVLQD